jgi:hypothetical protein
MRPLLSYPILRFRCYRIAARRVLERLDIMILGDRPRPRVMLEGAFLGLQRKQMAQDTALVLGSPG